MKVRAHHQRSQGPRWVQCLAQGERTNPEIDRVDATLQALQPEGMFALHISHVGREPARGRVQTQPPLLMWR